VTLNLLDRFAERARAVPDAVAIEASGIERSYGALQRRAMAVTYALREAGCVPGDRVAVWTSDRTALVAVMLGVISAGAVFVPLEHDAPAERLRQRLGRLRARVLLHDAHTPRASTSPTPARTRATASRSRATTASRMNSARRSLILRPTPLHTSTSRPDRADSPKASLGRWPRWQTGSRGKSRRSASSPVRAAASSLRPPSIPGFATSSCRSAPAARS